MYIPAMSPAMPLKIPFVTAAVETVIERWGFQVGNLRIKNGKCTKCGAEIDGVWDG